jgi:uncharacterized protein (DUF2267 family)
MHPTTAELFTETLEKTGVWLEELMEDLGNATPRRAYSVLRAVLHALRDRLTVDEAVTLGAQLPMLVRGFYYEGWRPAGRPIKYRHKQEFLDLIGELYSGLEESQREPAARAVFRLLANHVTGGELHHVRAQLPPELRILWYLPNLTQGMQS